ncbi:terpenoid synthase [Xylaria nigripes]|nr:terpenoid synthase [Xylaria nigripes]
MEKLKPKGSMGKEDAHDILQDFGDEVLTNKFDSNTPPATRMQAQFLSEMMEIDAPRAITSFKAWAKFVRQASKIKRDEIKTLKEYMPSRITDAGELILFAAITFGMKLTIPEEELDILMELIKPANAATCLVNDVYSWDKECKEVEMQGSTTLFNAIPIIMNERDVSEAEAIRICREEIEKNFRHFMCTIEKEKKEATLSKDVLTYLDAIMYMYIGNLVWSIACPRYNA